MRLRRRHPCSEVVTRAAAALKQIEQQIALLDRVRPLSFELERARLSRAFREGRQPAPRFAYAPAAELRGARSALSQLALALEARDDEQALLAERAMELELEARLAESVGTPAFSVLAARRFPLSPEHAALQEAAQAAVALPDDDDAADSHYSDDERDPHSLWSLLASRIERDRLPVRVELRPGLVALAAVADGVVRVRPGVRLSASVGRRIALHELDGHVRPRLAGRALGGVFLAGTARASEDEEGRAIWLEARAGLLGAARRRELGLRYLAAASVRAGAELWQTVAVLVERGASGDAAVELACRVHRGGGLGRELIYLSGYARAERLFAVRPRLECVLAHGRVSLAAAGRLLDAGSVELDDHGDVI